MTDYPRVAKVITRQGNDISDLCNRHADAQSMPPQVLVAGAIAESNLDEHAERDGDWPDVSFGLWQQTVRWAPIGDQTNTARNIASVRSALFQPEIAVEIAAPQYGRFWRQYGDGKETLARYNKPSVPYAQNPNKANIDRAWAASEAYVLPEGGTPVAEHEFQLGFLELADQMRADGADPGVPLTDEYVVLADADGAALVTRQNTTTGCMEWTNGAAPMFYSPKAIRR